MSVADASIRTIEPRRLRVERRLNVTPGQAALARVSGVLAALVVSGVVLTLTGRNIRVSGYYSHATEAATWSYRKANGLD